MRNGLFTRLKGGHQIAVEALVLSSGIPKRNRPSLLDFMLIIACALLLLRAQALAGAM